MDWMTLIFGIPLPVIIVLAVLFHRQAKRIKKMEGVVGSESSPILGLMNPTTGREHTNLATGLCKEIDDLRCSLGVPKGTWSRPSFSDVFRELQDTVGRATEENMVADGSGLAEDVRELKDMAERSEEYVREFMKPFIAKIRALDDRLRIPNSVGSYESRLDALEKPKDGHRYWNCSRCLCGARQPFSDIPLFTHCPHCGVRFEGEKEHDNTCGCEWCVCGVRPPSETEKPPYPACTVKGCEATKNHAHHYLAATWKDADDGLV